MGFFQSLFPRIFGTGDRTPKVNVNVSSGSTYGGGGLGVGGFRIIDPDAYDGPLPPGWDPDAFWGPPLPVLKGARPGGLTDRQKTQRRLLGFAVGFQLGFATQRVGLGPGTRALIHLGAQFAASDIARSQEGYAGFGWGQLSGGLIGGTLPGKASTPTELYTGDAYGIQSDGSFEGFGSGYRMEEGRTIEQFGVGTEVAPTAAKPSEASSWYMRYVYPPTRTVVNTAYDISGGVVFASGTGLRGAGYVYGIPAAEWTGQQMQSLGSGMMSISLP